MRSSRVLLGDIKLRANSHH